MKIVADENVDRLVIERLRSNGHEVLSIAREFASSPDTEVLSISNNQRALLITEDKDFGELVFHKRRSHFGVLLVRLEGMSRSERVRMVCDIVVHRGKELANSFSVLTPSSLRTRRAE
jgi:predicted nuclease of predicted toxin-antitoxin system